MENCKAGNGRTENRPTLTEVLEQTEKQLHGIKEIVQGMELKMSGPMPMVDCGDSCKTPTAKIGIYEQAHKNLEIVNNLAGAISGLCNML